MGMAISNVSVDGAAYGSNTEPIPASPPQHKSPPHETSSSGGNEAFDNEGVKRLIEEMQKSMDQMNVALQFSTYGENGKKVAITITDRETGKVIREVPSKDLQNLYMRMSELAGMIFNKVA